MTLDWQKYIEIADKFQYRAKMGDRADLRDDIVVRLAELARQRGQALTLPSMLRIASYVCQEYWHKLKRQPTIISLNYEVQDYQGKSAELWQTLADDKAIDLEAWQDAKRWLLGCPKRLVQIAHKRSVGQPLAETERRYFNRYRERELKKYQTALA